MTDRPVPPPDGDGTSSGRTLKLAMRVAVAMLASGAATGDVETTIGRVTRAYGTHGVQAAVTFSTISISRYSGDAQPVTMLHLVPDRTTDFGRLSRVSGVARRIIDGTLDVPAAEAALDRMEQAGPAYGRILTFAAPGLSAAGSTLMFGGNERDALVTLVIGLLVQPVLAALDRSRIPPFFRLAIGVSGTALLAALVVALDLGVNGGLVLTGSLLRFLPGYALVAGFRDLIDGSMVSGTARLAEALLLAAAVAGGAALSLGVASSFGVYLTLTADGQAAWGPVVSAAAALIAVGAFAIRLGVPARETAQAAILGALAWWLFQALAGLQAVDGSISMLISTVAVGALGRLLARRYGAPSALWVVPAILPFLPGLQMVQAMLAETEQARVNGLVAAAGTGFLIGIGVTLGDVLIGLIRDVRDQVVVPVVGAVAGGVEVFVIGPVGRVVDQARGEPAAAVDEPAAGVDQPVAAADQPDVAAEQPVAAADQPDVAAEQPDVQPAPVPAVSPARGDDAGSP